MAEVTSAPIETPRRGRSRVRFLLNLGVLLFFGTILVAIKTDVIKIFLVVSGSMEPTLQIGDRILVDSNAYPRRFDIVTLPDPDSPDEAPLVKRIVGLGGDTIKLDGGILYINGEEQYSSKVTSNQIIWKDTTIRVPNDCVFVLGDNRNNSYDSLNFGPVPLEKISAVLTVILWPPSHWGRVDKFKNEEKN